MPVDITKLPYAPWLENAIKILTAHDVHTAGIVARVEDDTVLTGYWNASANDKAVFASNIQNDITLDVIRNNADIIKQALEDDDESWE